MRRQYILRATAVVCCAGVAAFGVACGGGSAKPTASSSAAAANAERPGSSATSGPAAAQATIAASDAPASAVTFRVLAGTVDGNRDVEAFMPADIRIRAGDTIEWTAVGFEGHTITFGNGDDALASIGDYLLPNPDKPSEKIFNPKLALKSEDQGPIDGTPRFVSSGFIGVPAEQTYSLTFSKPGLYTYLCLVHPFTMTGTVTVEPAGTRVDSPETVSARGKAEAAANLDELAAQARRLAETPVTAPGPSESTIYYVQVGAITDHGQVAVYTPGSLDIKAGDTVIFQNDDRNFHNVIFKGDQELPPGIGIIPDPGGRGLNFSLSAESAVAVDPPPEGFDERTFLSSGSLGVLQPRLTWTLTFTKPGTYVYACTIHVLAGMTGVINVR